MQTTDSAIINIENPQVEIEGLNLYYGESQALTDLTFGIAAQQVTALIGPSGCGKSTLIRCINRMNDLVDGLRVEGRIAIDGEDINDPALDVIELRRKVGMVFQKWNPFPKSIYENIVYGLRIAGIQDKAVLDEAAEKCLKRAALWDEVKDRLHQSAMGLSGGQMQRLCIARAIAVSPEIILMDEPCSALDAEGTERIESLLDDLREQYTILIVTHNMGQARRASQECIFMLLGEIIEHGSTLDIFLRPKRPETDRYIGGHYG